MKNSMYTFNIKKPDDEEQPWTDQDSKMVGTYQHGFPCWISLCTISRMGSMEYLYAFLIWIAYDRICTVPGTIFTR